ncbi:MAG: CCA tRNA nucleotidyltransferase [Rickettsiales bacterium]|nr:CCA tRNA nucleotidyltransferase [Rickettsiales bacterium]
MKLKDLITFKDSKFIFDVLFQKDHNARFVGGCVRSSLLNQEITDIDIGTALYPNEVEKLFSKYSNVKIIDVGKEYGTIIIVINHHSYEITTLRRDVHTDGRYAVVEYTKDWQEDASRRDFTINAMSYSPKEDRLYDYFNGQSDLKIGLIKFIGDPDKRIQEDYLRILRLFRFYAYCGKAIDNASLVACKKYAQFIKQLSQERKMKELYQIVIHSEYIETLQLMAQNEIIEHVSSMPDWYSGINLCQKLEKICIEYDVKLAVLLKIFALFYKKDISSSQIAKEFVTLSKEDKKYLTALTKFVGGVTLSQVITKPHYYCYYYSEVLLDGFLYMQSRKEQIPKNDKDNFKKITNIMEKIPAFPLTGSDLISKFALKPGKELGELLKIAKDFWIESEFKLSKTDLLVYIKRNISTTPKNL